MKKTLHQKLRGIVMLALFLTATVSWGQINITGNSPYTYTENFDGYTAASSGSTGLPTGWTLTGGSGNYKGKGNGSSNAGGIWSYGTTGGSDWSLGALYSGSAALVTYTVTFTNKSGYTITALNMSYDFEGWRYAGNSGGITCTTTGLPASVATAFTSNYLWTTTPTTGSSTKSVNLTGLSIANNATFTISWRNVDATGSDNGVAVDNFNLQATFAVTAPVINSALTASSTYGTIGTYTTTVAGAATSYSAILTNGDPLSSIGASINTSTGVITFPATVAAATYNISITATNSGGSDTKTLVYTRNKANQTITFAALANKTYGDADFSLTASVASGMGITFTSSNEDVATISGNTVTITGPGTTTITASQPGDSNYNVATNVPRTLTVNPKTLTVVNPLAQNKIYDATNTATVTNDGLLGGIVGSDDVNIASYTANFNDKNVSNGKPVTTTFVLGGAQASRYTLTQPTGLTADITAKAATISGISIEDKIFDGGDNATIAGTPVLEGIVAGDDATLNSSAATAIFAQIDEGENIPVTVSGYSIDGDDAANYVLLQPEGLTADILDDGLQDQVITFNALSNVVYGDAPFALTATTTSPLAVTYTSSDESVATVSGNTLTITGVGTTTITALQAGDTTYSPALPVEQLLIVTPKSLTVGMPAVVTKVYDGTNTTQLTGIPAGVVGTDEVLLTGTGTFDNENVGTGKTVTTLYSISGADAANYTLVQFGDLLGDITAKPLTIDNATAQDKVYDGNTVAAITGTLNGIIGTDVVSFVGAAVFVSVDVAQDIEVTAAVTIEGTDASNYTIVQPTGLSANITPAGITVAATVSDKVYDRTTAAHITVTTINGVVDGDTITVTGGGTFENYNVATGKPVTANLVLGGTDAANYTITQPTGLTAAITKKDITADIAAAVVADKVYNNTAAAEVIGVVLNDVINGDETDVQVIAAAFAQETVGTGISVSGFVLSGAASGNYNLVQPVETLSGNITPATLTLNSAAAQNKVYDGTGAATITGALTGIASGDTVTYNGTGTFASVDVADGINVTAVITLSGTDNANYIITQPTGLTANITKKSVTVAAEAVSKVYDGNTATTVQNAYIVASDIISPDDVTLAETTVNGTFNSPTVANNKPVSATFTLTGADAGNYIITEQTYPANITAVTLTVDVTNAAVTTKTYDGTTAAQVTGAILTGVLAGDTVNAVTGTFNNANAGTERPVTILLTGTSAANYTLTQPEVLPTGAINKKDITATANNVSKVLNAANPALTISYNGFISGQTATNALNFVAPTATTTAVTSSPVGTYPVTLNGGSAANYNFTGLTNGWLSVNPASTGLITWTPQLQSNYGTSPWTPSTIAAGLSTTLNRGTSITATTNAAGSAWGGNGGWVNNGTTSDNNSFFFEVNVPAGKVLSFASMVGNIRRSNTGPSAIYVYYAVYPTGTAAPSTFTLATEATGFSVTSATGNPINLNLAGVNGLQAIQGGYTVKFRLNPGTGTSGGTFYINGNSSASQNTFVVNGTLLDKPSITSTLTDSSSVGATDTYQITATGTPQINLTATSLPQGATVNNTGLITFDGTTPAGIYNIALSASSYYGADTKTLVYTVNKLNQVLTFDPDPLPVKVIGEAPFLFEVSNTAGLPVNWSSSDESVVTIDAAGVITIVGPGTATITASNAGSDIYNPVTETRTITVSSGCFEWTGAVGTNWTDAGNWCGNIVPFATSDVTIADTANDPIITSGIATMHNLTVAAGANLTVNTGATLNVDNILNVNAAGTLTVQNNAALLQGEATVTNANTGVVTVNKNSNPLYRLDYTIWSSPVDNWTLGQFSPATAANRYYEYKYDTNGTAYVEAYWPLASSTQFTAAKGYLIRMPNVLSSNVTGTTNDGITTPEEYIAGTDNYIYNGIFTGAPHNGTITYPLSVEGSFYTAVGNPYPSPININEFFYGDIDPDTAGTQNNGDVMDIATGIYFWRKRNNSANSSYATINLGGYVQNPAEGGGSEQASFYSGDSQNWTLAQGQGFIVKTKNGVANPQLTFTNSMRTPSTGSSQGFFKSAPSTASRLWLNMVSESNMASQTMVGYFEDATLDLDYGFDAKKFTDGNTVAFYSLANETALAIQARPGFEVSDVVPMGYTAPASATLTVSLDHVDGLFGQGQKIYLRDNAEGIVRDLTQYDYTFTTEAGTFEGRFDVIYTTQALGTDNPLVDAAKVIVYTEGKVIGINSGNVMMNNVTIYDIRGRKLYSQDNINNTELKISSLTTEQQVLIVEVDTVNGKVSKRIVF